MLKENKIKNGLKVFLPLALAILLQGFSIIFVSTIKEILEIDMSEDAVITATYILYPILLGFIYLVINKKNIFINNINEKKKGLSIHQEWILPFMMLACQIITHLIIYIGDKISFLTGTGTVSLGSQDSSVINTVLIIGYAIFLGPIVEELGFRAYTMDKLNKLTDKFWIINIIQALLFGISHMQFIQVFYTFLLALLLGYIYQKTNNIKITIFMHILFNVFGFISFAWLFPGKLIILYYLIATIVLAFSVFLYIKDFNKDDSK